MVTKALTVGKTSRRLFLTCNFQFSMLKTIIYSEKFRDKVWILLSTSYSTILVQDAVEFLGLDRDTLIQGEFVSYSTI